MEAQCSTLGVRLLWSRSRADREGVRPATDAVRQRRNPVSQVRVSTTQREIDAEIAAIAGSYKDRLVDGPDREEFAPRLNYAPYRSSLLRHPTKDLHHADPEGIELVAPCFGPSDVDALEADLTIQHRGEP